MYGTQLFVQDGKCAICDKHQSSLDLALRADYDRVSGNFRGLLCIQCTLALSLFDDSIDNLLSAIGYLHM